MKKSTTAQQWFPLLGEGSAEVRGSSHLVCFVGEEGGAEDTGQQAVLGMEIC